MNTWKNTWKNIKNSYRNNKFKISVPTWNEEFELPDRSYSISNIWDYLEYILKKHGEKTVNPSIRIYINKIKSRITFKIKIGYYIEPLTPKILKSLGSAKSKITKDEDRENLPYLEITEAHCSAVNNNYQQNSRVLYTFVPKKLFSQLYWKVVYWSKF